MGEAFFGLPHHDERCALLALGDAAGTKVLCGGAVAGDAVRHRLNGHAVKGVRQLLAECVQLHERALPITLHGDGNIVRVGLPRVGRLVVENLRGHGGHAQRLVVYNKEHGHTLQFASGGVVEVVRLVHGVERHANAQRHAEVRLAESNATDGHLAVGHLDFFIVNCHVGWCGARDNPLVGGDSLTREDVARRDAAVRIGTKTNSKSASEGATKVANDRHFLAADLLAQGVGVGDVGHVNASELLATTDVSDKVTEFAAGAANNEIVFHGTLNFRVKRFILLYIDTRAYRNTRL